MNTGRTLDDIRLHFETTPQRVVSLVPSYTESMFDLGFGAYVVGATDYCKHPQSGLENVPRIGGPKIHGSRIFSVLPQIWFWQTRKKMCSRTLRRSKMRAFPFG